MERGGRFEQFEKEPRYGDSYEKELESLVEYGESLDDDFGRNFEAPRQLDAEDEKAKSSEKDLEASDIQEKLTRLSESISASSQALASLPLTLAQQIIIDKINILLTEYDKSSDDSVRRQIKDEVKILVQDLAEAPVTDEQGTLLDDILGMIDQRDKLEISLQEIYRKY